MVWRTSKFAHLDKALLIDCNLVTKNINPQPSTTNLLLQRDFANNSQVAPAMHAILNQQLLFPGASLKDILRKNSLSGKTPFGSKKNPKNKEVATGTIVKVK